MAPSMIWGFLLAIHVLLAVVGATNLTPEVQQWIDANEDFWEQQEADAIVYISGGAKDAAGNFYFAGSKTLDISKPDLLNIFVACVNTDGALDWTKEWGTDQADAATSIAILNDADDTEFLYVSGYTWGYLDEGGHALNGFGQYGGRDVVLLKVSLEGEKLWMRQFGTTANDVADGVKLDGSFNTLLLSGGCVTSQVGGSNRAYDFAVSLSFDGDILDYTMDGGVTLTPRRSTIREGGLVADYAVVLNRQPVTDVEVQAQDVRLLDPSNKTVQQLQFLTSQRVVFTPENWNREQFVQLTAVDDDLAEGRHYAVVAHTVTSSDPNFKENTPFLAGRTVTIQIDDNDIAGVFLSRQHVFVAEGGGKDSYEIVLTSRPWHPVKVVVKALHANQTAVFSEASSAEEDTVELTFQPDDWNKPQHVVVSAVDDVESEVEYGGLYNGGPLLHYTESKDIRYHTRRPQCFDAPNCDPDDSLVCLLSKEELKTGQTVVRVCDLTHDCAFAQGNGACIANVVSGNIPKRFGNPPLDTSSSDTPTHLSYTALIEVLAAEKSDLSLSEEQVLSESDFVPPPPELRGFVLSFLGLMNIEQARKMSTSPRDVQHTLCAGLVRLETMRWAYEGWPVGYVSRVLTAAFAMFPKKYSLERHSWNCGMANFLPGSTIDVSIWENDPGVTLSTADLEVLEGDLAGAAYDVVLNAPPSTGRAKIVSTNELPVSSAYCKDEQSDTCGFWGDFQALAAEIYDQSAWISKDAPNVSIAIEGNSQLTISPSLLTFTATDWFKPQRVVVRAVDDAVAEPDVSFTVSHRVQNSMFGYSESTAFWFQGTNTRASELYSAWDGGLIPYNPLPTVLHSPTHKRVTVFVRDNDVAEVNVVVNQPEATLATKEASDTMNWVGDYVTALAFHDVSVSSGNSEAVLPDILMLGADVVTFMKFHLPHLHEGDTSLKYSKAMLVLHQTPYETFDVSELDSGSSAAGVGVTREYVLKVTAVTNAWTSGSIREGATPRPLSFLNEASIEITATVEKSRSIEADISPLLAEILPTRLSVVSLKIQVLPEGGKSIATTQLCSSVFERKLRPLLSLSYAFSNILSGLAATQSSTAVASVTEASLATNGAQYDDSIDSTAMVATTTSEKEPWWEVLLPQLTKLGTIAIFLPASMVKETSDAFNIIVIASLKSFDAQVLALDDALTNGCPSACPKVEYLPVRRGILLWNVQAGAVAVRIYRQGVGSLQLAQVQAFEPFLTVTLTADGAGIRSRLKSDWGPSPVLLQSWRLLQTVRRSENENLALGMATRQSSTQPSDALAYLAVDGLQHTGWDPLIIRSQDDRAMSARSTRTGVETNPWWEVDLGRVKPIRSVVLYPYVGNLYEEHCAGGGTNGFPSWSGDLYDYSHTDSLLQLKAPFSQQFDVLLSDESLMTSDGTASTASVTISKTLSFSCASYTNSVAWENIFSKARFVTVRRRGAGVLMLNEVEVLRWNPVTKSRYLLLDLFGTGEKPLALSSVQVFPPSDVVPTDSKTLTASAPLSYKIHSVSSQLPDSASALLNAKDKTSCYVASAPSYHEWLVLEFQVPVEIGLIDVQTQVDSCSATNVEAVAEFSVASHGSELTGIRSEAATQALTETSSLCELDAAGVVVSPSPQCASFTCDKSCQSPLRVDGLVLSDFIDLAVLAKSELLPVNRLPLSVNENRVLLLRANPVVIWPFDDTPKVLVSNDEGEVSWDRKGRATGALELKPASTPVDLSISDHLESTFFSSAMAIQPTMSSFSLEFWFQINQNSIDSVAVATLNGKDASGDQVTFGIVGFSSETERFYLKMTNPENGVVCRAELADDAEGLPFAEPWHQAVAIYDPVSSSISFSVCVSSELQSANCFTSSTSCNMALLDLSQKIIRFEGGFAGKVASVSWFLRALATTEILDHYHDFLGGVSTEATAAHNTYSIALSAKPLQPVTVKLNAESACYRFNLCDVSTIPSVLVFSIENWNLPQLVHVLATNDQLYEGLHSADVFHVASSPPLYQLTKKASTSSVTSGDLLSKVEDSVAAFYRDFVVYRVLEQLDDQSARQDALMDLRLSWASQSVQQAIVAANAYAEAISVASVVVSLTDVTVPGIEFSTTSLSVSEDGTGNDYQVILLSKPTKEVRVTLDIASGCYRRCRDIPLCPSHTVELSDGKFAVAGDDSFLTCGDGSKSVITSKLLCNITVSPDVLVFTTNDWNLPKTVRVVAVDDHLDEEDVHVAIIRSTAQSSDPLFGAIMLPDIVVTIADNDDTDMVYSTKLVSLFENNAAVSALHYPHTDSYTLQLLTEPYTDVAITMSNEANEACYRQCGYPFDGPSCGVPRQQSVSLVHLSSISTREIHQISLRMDKTTEVQRIATHADHVDQVFLLSVSGGFSFEIQAIVFTFNDDFKSRFASADAIASATSYGSTFAVTNGDGSSTSGLDLFATAVQVQTAINGLFAGGTNAVSVDRTIQYAASTLTWSVTFLRFVTSDGTFPLLSASVNGAILGDVACQRTQASISPTGTFKLSYGAATFSLAVLPTAEALENTLSSQVGVHSVSVSRRLLSNGGYGFEYIVTFVSVETFSSLAVNSTSIVVANMSQVAITTTETQSPVLMKGAFVIDYFTPLNIATTKPNRSVPIFWNDSAETLATKLGQLQGLANVMVSREKLSAEGGMVWTVQFLHNYGDLPSLVATSLNLTGKGVTVGVSTIRDGEPLRGNLMIQMGGWFKKTDPRTGRAYMMDLPLKNTTLLPFNASHSSVREALFALGITEMTNVTRLGVDCDAFSVCNGYNWVISYLNSPGNLPPIGVFPDQIMIQSPGLSLTSATVANGTYLGGVFNLKLELLDPDTNRAYIGTTWWLPVNVSAIGMDEALEALDFVRSNREKEYDPETKGWRGLKFDTGVRVYREGPNLDGGHTWRLEWALENSMRFADLKITLDVSRITQEIDPLPVPSEHDLQGKPRCSAIPSAIFQPDLTDPLGLRGYCVYAIASETTHERLLCNYTVLNPWIVFTPENWCIPQQVKIEAVDDYLDEYSTANSSVTVSSVTHRVFSDDYNYLTLALADVTVKVESDDVAKVLVSESALIVTEGRDSKAQYFIHLNSEPLADVKVTVLPWLDGNNTQCYRFGLCNVTLPVSEFVFTPRNWNIQQKVEVLATDDDLDEYDTHTTGISHTSISADPKYDKMADIAKVDVAVRDNDVSGFKINKVSVNVTEGGATDAYTVVLTSEPFAKVTVSVTNIGTVGNFAVPNPSKLTFTWKNWNITQLVTVTAFDDKTEDVVGSSSHLNHSLATNDLIYGGLKNLALVKVYIADNDKSGIELSTREMHAVESNTTTLWYSVRLTSEPWEPVVLSPNANNECYMRLQSERVCNVSLSSGSTSLYFGASNWSVWQNVSFVAVDDWLDEADVHSARISHSSVSSDPLYTVSDYKMDVKVLITDNDVSLVNVSLQSATNQLHVAEGSFNDSYRVYLNSEPCANVTVMLRPAIEKIVSLDSKGTFSQPQVGTSFGSSSSSGMKALGTEIIQSIQLVFTPLDWFRPRIVTVFAIDDEISEAANQFSSVLHSVSSPDAAYNVPSSISIVAVSVMINDREAIPPPLPVNAMFDSSGARIVVAFDSSVYHAASMDVGTSGTYVTRLKTFSCGLVFNFAGVKYVLGSQADCLWVDGVTLRIELSAGATIAAGDKLVLNECRSLADGYCNATDVLRALPSSRAFSQATITVQVPSSIVQPSGVLIVPENAGSCGTWTADASLSSGAGGRPFAQLVWFALPASLYPSSIDPTSGDAGLALYQRLEAGLAVLCPKYKTDWTTGTSSTTNVPAGDLTLAAAASSDLTTLASMAQLRSACYLRAVAQNSTAAGYFQLKVNGSLLESGAAYHVGLKLVNAFAQTSVVVKTVKVQTLPGPAVFIVGDSTQTVTKVGPPVVMQVDATVSCPTLSSSDVAFRWTSQSSDGTTVDFSKDNSRDPRVFRVPRSALQAGLTYTFRAEAYIKGSTSSQSSFTSIVVVVSSSSPQVFIKGGDCALGQRDTMVLDGSTTVDPDFSSTPFTYTWTCQDVTNSSAVTSCMNASAPSSPLALDAATEPVLRIAPFNLVPSRQLNFSLTASKGSRSATASSSIWTMAGYLPVVQVTASAGKINPSSRLSLSGVVTSDYPFTTRWTQTLGDLVLPTANVSNSSDVFTLPLTSANNAIPSYTLTAGLTYTFRLVATDTGGNIGFGSVSIAVNSPPSSGVFIVTPQSGYAMQDLFSLACSLWSDDADDYPLSYDFGVLSSATFRSLKNSSVDINTLIAQLRKAMTPLVASQASPQATAKMFPPTNMADNENVTVLAFISDRFGATALAYDDIEVLMPQQAKASPALFVSNLFSDTGTLKTSSDASDNVRQVLAAAMVLEKAFGSKSTARRLATCPEGFMGSDCSTKISLVQKISGAILSYVSTAVSSVEPSSSGLGQQSRVLVSVVRAAAQVLGAEDLNLVTQLMSGIAGSALTLDAPDTFLDSSSDTLLEVISILLGLGNSTAGNVTSWTNMVRTLQSLAALSSDGLLADEPPAVLEASDIRTYSAKGVRFAGSSDVSMALTPTAVSCLESNLFLDALSFGKSPHPASTLNNSEPISRLTLFSVHSQAALDNASTLTTYASDTGVTMQSLPRTSSCVKAASEMTRRLDETEKWMPLLAVTIPHARELSTIEQSNFSTTCRTWDAAALEWAVDVCFKDDSTSAKNFTVCYCTQVETALQVLVTLEERLDFYALHPDLYRNDQPSLVVSVTLAVLVGVFVLVAKVGQQLDVRDVEREKVATIRRLNRAKWSELEARTQTNNVFGDFDAYYVAQKQKRLEKRHTVTTYSESSASLHEVHTNGIERLQEPLDTSVQLPDEARTLFGSSALVNRQYQRVTLLFRVSNLALILLGIVLLFAGIEVHFVLGRTPAELVLYLYSGPLGAALVIGGAVLVTGGIVGVLLARREASNAARTAYFTSLSVALLIQFLAVLFAFHLLENLDAIPRGVALALRSKWDALSLGDKTQLQLSYGCCGFLDIKEEATCPEEALTAVPPRTCSVVLGSQASALFSSSFIYVEVLLLVEVVCVAVANFLIRWRHIRLVQLASGPEVAIVRSLVSTALLCSLSPLYALLCCAAIGGVIFGVDLMVHWGAMADQLVSALFGAEIGVFIITGSGVYLFLTLWTLHALGRRDIRALRWILGLSLVFLLLTLAVRTYVGRLHADFYLDPLISQAVEAQYVALPRSTTLLRLEMALGCCGFRSSSQGVCVEGTSNTGVPTCRVQVEDALERALALSEDRLAGFVVAQAIMLVLLAWLCFQLRQYSNVVGIRSVPTATEALEAYKPPTMSQKLCAGGLGLLNVGAVASGIGILCLGIDILLELNVLQISYLLRVFDRRLGVYLIIFGGVMELFALFGGAVAWLGSQGTQQHRPRWKSVRKWLVIWYSVACVVLFVTAFVLAGVGHKLSTQFMLTTDGEGMTAQELAVDMRMKNLWSSAPSTTKLFVQNTFKCCGYDRVEAANGSISYTLQAEQFGWRRLSSTSMYHVYSDAKKESSKTRMLTETQTEVVRLDSRSQCPNDVSNGCASSMKRYVSRVARITWKLCIGLAGYSGAALLCAWGLYDTDQRERKWQPGWRLRIELSVLLLSNLAGILAALACFIFGLDVAVNWTLFSSTAFQMVFAKSMGASLMLYGVLALLIHSYSMRAVLHLSVPQLFLQCVGRFMLEVALFAAVGFTAYLSHYSSLSDEHWHAQLADFLDDQWSLLPPSKQNAIALEFSCCGFNDPVLVAGQGVVFDRPALGYPGCSLAISRGCKVPLMIGVESSFTWLFAFLLALALLEIEVMLLGALVLHDVRKYEGEAWFALESRLRYVAGSFRRDFQRNHVLVSIGARFDARLTRTQRAISVLCAWAASLAVYAGHFATKGCYRTALKSCKQPGAGVLLGLGLAYGGVVGLAVQTATVALFEHVRHRTDEETKEVSTARQRKEKVMLFRTPWFRRRPDSYKVTEQSALSSDTSTLGATQATTEERWFVWLARFVAVTFQTCGAILLLGGCALATLLGLLRLGYNNSLYGVPLDENVFELLALACGLIAVALLAALANDLRERHLKRSYRRRATPTIVLLVVVAITSVLALGVVLLTVFMIHEVVQDDASALNSWSVRATGFSVAERLEVAWNTDLIGYAKDTVQQEMRCCGFWDATNAPFLPCPEGDPVDVTYEALSVSGTVLTETKQQFTTLPGCRAGMLARFQAGADVATYCALTAVGLLFLMILSSLFLARELVISRDVNLKLRVPDSAAGEVKRDVRETFETVVGLKIAAPTRGKLRSQILASSLDSVAPSMANELAAAPLNHNQEQISSTVTGLNHQGGNKDPLLAKTEPPADDDVPYPASIVYVVFAFCLVWLVIMAYVITISAMELGLATSWRCVLAWSIGVAIQELVAEPIVIFVSIVARTLHHWWSHTLLARIILRGRALLRIGPQDAKALERGASLTLYERLRYTAAVRIQRRLLTRVTRARYLRHLRDRKQEQHRLLAVRRREILRRTIKNFSEEEIDAFRLLFTSVDAAKLGLVSYTAIAKAVYELGVHVPATKVRELLEAFDPAYADLVDFEHFLYGMHCVREYHQQLETQSQGNAEQPASKKSIDEKLVSSSDRFGPRADPRAELLVKRQNLLRELQDRRESLAHKLMRKVSGRAPPLLQHGKSSRTAAIDEGNEDLLSKDEETAEKTNPTGTYVFWQNRKLSPKKRALESVLKKKHQERLQTEKPVRHGADNDTDVPTTARAAVTLSPTKRTPQNMGSKITITSLGNEKQDSDKVAPIVSEELERSPSSDVESRAATEASEMPKTLPKAEEAKPFGAYLLLSKQPLSRPPAASTTDPNDAATSPRPTTAHKPKPSDAQSALLKALKKQKSKKPM